MVSQIKSQNAAGELQLRVACAELQGALHAGDNQRTEDYLTRFPDIADNPEQALDLIYTEYIGRLEQAQERLQEEFYQRFPQWQEELAEQFKFHDWLRDSMAPTKAQPLPKSITVGPQDGMDHVGPSFWPNKYEILQETGRGAMGVVYLAWQTSVQRLVAVKMVLAGANASADDLSRFRVEAMSVARLQHPNIVQIYEVGQQDHCPFLVFEYISGGNLSQKIAGKPMEEKPAAQLVEKLARAVHYAHQQGIIHRDLSPTNILLTEEGEPKITDFGLAKILVGGDSTTTKNGMILGTPDYMAPEQAEGRNGAISPATDVYSLGTILYELLIGRTPFRSESWLKTMMKVRLEIPIPPRRYQPHVAHDLQTICLKCLQKDPSKRYGSAQLLADDLHRFLHDKPIQGRPESIWSRSLGWLRKQL